MLNKRITRRSLLAVSAMTADSFAVHWSGKELQPIPGCSELGR